MVEFSDFPPEIHQMIVERCDFLSRFNLRSTSKSMLEIVDTSKFDIPKLNIMISEEWISAIVEYFGNSGQHEMYIKETDMEESKWLVDIMKNAEIEIFEFDSREVKSDEFLKMLVENLKSPVKARKVQWWGKIDLKLFDEKVLKELEVQNSEGSNFSLESMEMLKDVDKLSISGPTQATDEFVLSLNATEISLESDHFTAVMVNRLVEKFMMRGTIDSSFDICNKKKDFRGSIIIPDGFVRDYDLPNDYSLTVDNKEMYLDLDNFRVSFRISEADEDTDEDVDVDYSEDSDSDFENYVFGYHYNGYNSDGDNPYFD